MEEQAAKALKGLTRDELEDFTLKAIVNLSAKRREARSLELFQFVILSFLAGAILAALAFLLGGSLGR